MKEVTNIFLSREFIIMYGLIGIMFLCIIIVFIIDKRQKQAANSKEQIEPFINPLTEDAVVDTVLDKGSSIDSTTSSVEVLDNNNDEEITYTNNEPNAKEAKEELNRLTDELKKEDNQIQNSELTDFELTQEEEAIISIDELMKKAQSLPLEEEKEFNSYEDEGNALINLEELELKMQAVKQNDNLNSDKANTKTVKLDDFNTVVAPKPDSISHFKSSPIISPVFGLENDKTVKEGTIELENTANYDKLDEEIRKTNEFLQILRELQKKLD